MINYLIEVDIIKVDGTTREYETLRFSSLTLSPLIQEEPFSRNISDVGLPTITKSIQNIFYGIIGRNFGTISIDNNNGKYNYLLTNNWTLENRPVRILTGDTTDEYASYETIVSGKTGTVTINSRTIDLEINDGSLDLSTISYIDKEDETDTIENVINEIIETAGVEKDTRVDDWLTTYGSISIYLNYSDATLVDVLSDILTPLASYYGFDNDGIFYIKEFSIPESGTPVLTIGEREVLDGYSKTSLNRNYWRVVAQYYTSNLGSYSAESVKSFEGIEFSGSATNVNDNTGLPTGEHEFQVGDTVRIYEDTDFQGEYEVLSDTTTTVVVIDKAYESHSFTDAIIRSTLQYPFAKDSFQVGGIFTTESDAQDAADKYLEILKIPRYKYSVVTKPQVTDVNILTLGDYLCLNLDQPYGTVYGVLTNIIQDISENTVQLEITA
jgi:hypothetical protein